MITIVDYGMGNIGSIKNMLKSLGLNSEVTSEKNVLAKAKRIILPGVGAFDAAMNRINASGIREILDYKANVEQVPFLGICLGMQLLTCSSEEGMCKGLGWIPATTKRFPLIEGFKVPHMGWNSVKVSNVNPLISQEEEGAEDNRFYFVHSYYVSVNNKANSILKTEYGLSFDAGIQKNNILGVQFHPEKSHRFGKKILLNFSRF